MNVPFAIWEKLPTALFFWLSAMNLVTFLLFGLDKARARRQKSRIPERTLFWLSILGGSLGALAGMQLWRHKTQHDSFRIGIPAILLLQSAVALWFLASISTT